MGQLLRWTEKIQNKYPLASRIINSLLRISIAKKLLFGYLSLALLIIIISIFSLYNLERLNTINTSILQIDVPIVESTNNMVDNLLAQELYARRYLILKGPDMLDLFWKRSEEFEGLVAMINKLPGDRNISLDQLTLLHKEYNNIFTDGIKNLDKSSSAFTEKHERMIKEKQNELVMMIKKISNDSLIAQNSKTLMTANIGTMAFKVTAIFCGMAILMGILTATLITRNLAGSISLLKLATKNISEGKFYNTPSVDKSDELGDLSIEFNKMAKRLQTLEKMDLDASPLTRLPGGIAIEKVLASKLISGKPLAFCLIDMDNFKAYNDSYGYIRGNDIIKLTAQIIKLAVADHGADDDFVGHIGGDDFVVITSPNQSTEICRAIIDDFDNKVLNFYNKEDRQRKKITGKSRSGKKTFFPVTTLSIAIVTNTKRKLENHIQVGEIAAELKEYAKSISGSIYVVDKRNDEGKADMKVVPLRKT